MSQTPVASAVAVQILDREYRIACEPAEREALLRAAANLDQRMRQLKNDNRTLTLERVAVLAALTIAAESLSSQQNAAQLSGQLDQELKRLNARLDAVLSAA
jgi:cell division protein ZapA